MLTVAAQGREVMTGDEDEGGGADGLVVAMQLRRSPGEASARTGCAVTRRVDKLRWRRNRRRGEARPTSFHGETRRVVDEEPLLLKY